METSRKHLLWTDTILFADSHLGGLPSATLNLLPPELNMTQVPGEREPSLILDTRRRRAGDNMLMLVMGSQAVTRDHEIGEILGRRR